MSSDFGEKNTIRKKHEKPTSKNHLQQKSEGRLISFFLPSRGWNITATEDASAFTSGNLSSYNVVTWLNTTGDVLDASQQTAFENYITAGGAYVGIHSASDTEKTGWAWYGAEMLGGAWFDGHPPQAFADVIIEDNTHPATSFLPTTWNRKDEWYNYQVNPRTNVTSILASLDESTYTGGTMGDHPIMWTNDVGSGRVFFTGGGHTNDSFNIDTNFQNHLIAGIEWAMNYTAPAVPPWTGPAPVVEDFTRQTLATGLNKTMEFDISDDGRIFIIGRCGEFYGWDLDTESATLQNTLATDCTKEWGGIGLALDPNFETNNYIYIHYTHATIAKNMVSRFVVTGANALDLGSESVLFEYNVQVGECCHMGGSLEFGPNGNLFIANGDNVNPFQSDKFAPIDEQPGRAAFDAQGISANTNDLRGKILRITPTAAGGYTIPAGNLFTGDSTHRGEIYTMGHRNPFRITIDQETGWLYWGEIGPDSGVADANRGPAGYDELNLSKTPGNYGWPYFAGLNEAYNDYDFATSTSGPKFDPNNVVNDSPNNTGATSGIPNAQESWVYMSHRSLMTGGVYRYDNTNYDPYKFPSYYHGDLIYWNYNSGRFYTASADPDGSNPVVNEILSSHGKPIDALISPQNNRLYVLVYSKTDYESLLYRNDYGAPLPPRHLPRLPPQPRRRLRVPPIILKIRFRGCIINIIPTPGAGPLFRIMTP